MNAELNIRVHWCACVVPNLFVPAMPSVVKKGDTKNDKYQ
jgi:hypothetical protein